jgi:hypothetical protein
MAKGENTGLWIFLLVAGLFYVYYRHEQQTGGGKSPPGAAPSASQIGGGMVEHLLDFLGGVGSAAHATGATAPPAAHPAVHPAVAPHPATQRTAVHPVPPTAHPLTGTDPYAQWRGILEPPMPPSGAYYATSNHVGTWFDQAEPGPYMQSMPRQRFFGNVGGLF